MLKKWNDFLNKNLDLDFGTPAEKSKKKLSVKQSTAILLLLVTAILVGGKILVSLGTEILPGTM